MNYSASNPAPTMTSAERLACVDMALACARRCQREAKRMYARRNENEAELYEWMRDQFLDQAESHRSKA